MALYDAVDLDWTWDGDVPLDASGDLQDTLDDFIRSLENEIQSVMKSETGDWQKHPKHAANLADFLGEPNTRGTGTRIEDRVKTVLTTGTNLVLSGDLAVRVVPISYHEVLIVIKISAVSTALNRLRVGEPLQITLLYDTMENGLFFVTLDQRKRDELINGG